MSNIGQKVKGIRELHGYSQEYMATVLGISQKTYSLLENDQAKWDIDRLIKVSEILEIDVVGLIAEPSSPMIFNNCTQEHFGYIYMSAKDYVKKLEEDNEYLKKKIDELLELIAQNQAS